PGPGGRGRPRPAPAGGEALGWLGPAPPHRGDPPGGRRGRPPDRRRGPPQPARRRPAFTLGPVSLEVGWGDRLALVGPNGSGKTTLLHALLGRLPLDAGDRWVGPGVVVGEIGQRRDAFEPAPTLLAGFQAATGLAAVAEARSALAAFGLSATHVGRPPGSLSPGERTRAELAVLQVRGVNLLVLDEPTNHLDIKAIEQLEQALAGFPGTLVVVTHDRRLLEAVGPTRVVDVAGGRVTERR